MEFLRGHEREPILKGVSRLGSKDGVGSGASSVGFKLALFQDQPEKLVILNHSEQLKTANDERSLQLLDGEANHNRESHHPCLL
jgi:hypothetical protein